MAFDPACYDLARHFLGESAPESTVLLLAQYIQDTIEDWLAIREETKRVGDWLETKRKETKNDL
jgi:hypothetical protein